MSKPKVTITGCCGFIGRHLTRKCLDMGYEVVGIDNQSSADMRTFDFGLIHRMKFMYVDLYRPIPTSVVSHMANSSVVFHMAALARVQPSFTDPYTYMRANVLGTTNVLEAMRKLGLKNIVFSSSSSVYGQKNDPSPSVETDPTNPTSPYALQKKMCEDLLQFYSNTYGFDCKILRYFNVYGDQMISTGPYMQALQVLLNQKRNNEKFTVVGDGNQRRDFTHVNDVVAANLAAAYYPKTDIFNIGTGNTYSILDLCAMIDPDREIEFLMARNEPDFVCANNEKAQTLLGWNPIENLPDWIKEQN